jgi:hypothetical protein
MEPVTGTVTIRTALTKATAVSVTGYKVADAAATSAGGTLTLQLTGQPQVVYYLLEAK